jgi:hypothetical protein
MPKDHLMKNQSQDQKNKPNAISVSLKAMQVIDIELCKVVSGISA